MADVSKYLTVQEAAEIIGMTTSRVRQALRQDEMRGIRKGKIWLITKAEAIRYRDDNPDHQHMGRPRGGKVY
jgi:excisionase family DNA binding protein